MDWVPMIFYSAIGLSVVMAAFGVWTIIRFK
jgi:hypothetical protein